MSGARMGILSFRIEVLEPQAHEQIYVSSMSSMKKKKKSSAWIDQKNTSFQLWKQLPVQCPEQVQNSSCIVGSSIMQTTFFVISALCSIINYVNVTMF